MVLNYVILALSILNLILQVVLLIVSLNIRSGSKNGAKGNRKKSCFHKGRAFKGYFGKKS